MTRHRMRTRAYNPDRITQKKIERYKITNDIPLTRARVVNNFDPEGRGRVQIRVLADHGMGGFEGSTADEDLPWALPCFPFASYDAGTYLIPEVNTTVWVMYEDGKRSKPVYLGGMYGSGTTTGRSVGTINGSDFRFQQLYKTETPDEALSPETRIIYKSPKGALILMEEEYGNESLLLRDQLGQQVEFKAPFTEELPMSTFDNIPNEDYLDVEDKAEIITTAYNGSKIHLCSDRDGCTLDAVMEGEKPAMMSLNSYDGGFSLTGDGVSIQGTDGVISIDASRDVIIKAGTMEVSFGAGGLSIHSDEELVIAAPTVTIKADTLNLPYREE